jgi:hypothetical protein
VVFHTDLLFLRDLDGAVALHENAPQDGFPQSQLMHAHLDTQSYTQIWPNPHLPLMAICL